MQDSRALILISAISLFLELLLIRLLSTEVNIFAYLQNSILVVCILGMGMGCWTYRQPISFRNGLIPLLFLIFLVSFPYTRMALIGISKALSLVPGFTTWHYTLPVSSSEAVLSIVIGLLATYILLFAVWEVFVPLGRLLARLMNDFDPVHGYSLNVAASLVGIWFFVGLCALKLPPPAWIFCAGVLLVPLLKYDEFPSRRGQSLFLLASIIGVSFLGLYDFTDHTFIRILWSPYQKLELHNAKSADFPFDRYNLRTNNSYYQKIIDLGRETTARAALPGPAIGQYDLPVRLHPAPKRVLIVGAGTGNDVAGALRNGASQVTAVEIDPDIFRLGTELHPEKPYSDPRVHAIVDDARSYFMRSQERFDVVIFGLLDSHTTGAMTNARLDHFVYTRESLTAAKNLLAPGGVFILSFESQRPFITDRISRLLTELFGTPPLAFQISPSPLGWGGVMFLSGDQDVLKAQIEKQADVAELIKVSQREYPLSLPHTTKIVEDDWPYIYLEQPTVPLLQMLLSALLLILYFHGKRRLGISSLVGRWSNEDWHFFFLGAAFMLLEMEGINRAAVSLGSTWMVSAIVISAVLVMVLIANLLYARVTHIPSACLYALLIGTCISLYFVSPASCAHLPMLLKVLAVGALSTLPMLFSGIIFIRSYARADNRAQAIGSNLFGAVLGGALQVLTFLTGISSLLLLVAGFYGCACFIDCRRSQAA